MEETVTRNRELFYRIAELIEANPELYDQRSWGGSTPCGTAQCIAGHAAALAGWEPLRYHVGSEFQFPPTIVAHCSSLENVRMVCEGLNRIDEERDIKL